MVSGISAILGLVSLLGFILFLVGIGLVVISASQGRAVRGGIILAVFGLVLGGLFQLISQGVVVVRPTERAVVFRTLSGELTTPRGPGTSIIVPVFEEAIIYSTGVDNYTMSATPNEGDVLGDDAVTARTEDGQEVSLDITILFRVDGSGESINHLHTSWYDVNRARPNYRDGFVRPTVRALTRDVTSRFTANEIYGVGRDDMVEQMQADITARFADEGLLVEDLLLRNVTFSDQFTNAIELAQVAEQETRRAEIEVRRREQEAEQARVQATGLRDAAITTAQGESEAIVLRAQAEAEALRLVSEAIADNPALIPYLYVQNLSDNINIALVPANSPFLFDLASINSFAQTEPTPTAPADRP
ncbi:MAG: SPFH domain-containing protein [Phototrophicaceae bacterium]|jgi:regulator of protease activity HflC (stomatin/prohibitin superfamily)